MVPATQVLDPFSSVVTQSPGELGYSAGFAFGHIELWVSPLLEDGGWGRGCLLQRLHLAPLIRPNPRSSLSSISLPPVSTCAIGEGSLLPATDADTDWLGLLQGFLEGIQGGPWKCKKHSSDSQLGRRDPRSGTCRSQWWRLRGPYWPGAAFMEREAVGPNPSILTLDQLAMGKAAVGPGNPLRLCYCAFSNGICSLKNVDVSDLSFGHLA